MDGSIIHPVHVPSVSEVKEFKAIQTEVHLYLSLLASSTNFVLRASQQASGATSILYFDPYGFEKPGPELRSSFEYLAAKYEGEALFYKVFRAALPQVFCHALPRLNIDSAIVIYKYL